MIYAASVAAGEQLSGEAVESVCGRLAARGQFIEDRGLARWPDGTVSGRYAFRHALYRDVRYAVPFFVQLWMFASPVAYPSSLVPERWQWLYGLNPMAGVIEGFRWSLTGQGRPVGLLMAASTLAVLVLGSCGWMYFRRMEGTIADVV